MKSYKTLLLNANYKPLKIIRWQRAIVLVYENKVIELDFYKNEKIKDGRGRSYTIPSVVVLREYIAKGYTYPRFTKDNVFIRDNHKCQYCQKSVLDNVKLNLDHLHPRCLGGKSNWYNIIVSCVTCNRKKGNKTCEQVNMYPVKIPGKPIYNDLYIGINPLKDKIPEEWAVHLPNILKVKNHVAIKTKSQEKPIYI